MLSRAFIALLLLVASAASVAAQSTSVTDYKQGVIGFQRQGTQQFIGAQNAISKAMAPLGYIDTVSGKFMSAPGKMEIKTVAPLDMSLAGTKNPNAIMAAAGNLISFCPSLACIFGPPDGSVVPAFFDHQRTSFLVSSSSSIDAQAEEQTFTVTTNIDKGKIKTYFPNTAYNLGDNVLVPAAIYRVTKAGTTSANSPPPGSRPTSAPFKYTDGTVEFTWINDQAIGGKLGVYFETQCLNGSGSCWGFANNFQIQPGAVYENAVRYGIENDFTNNDVDCPLGIDCTAYRIGVGGKKSTQAIDITTANTPATGPALIWGIRFEGQALASESHLACDAKGAKACLASNALSQGISFSQAFIADNSTAPSGFLQTGSYTNGINLNGAYSGAQIVGNNFAVLPNGGVIAASATVGGQSVLTAQGAWAAFTPTGVGGGTSFTTGTLTGRYRIVDKTLFVQFRIPVTTAGTGSATVNVNLPAGLTVPSVCTIGGQEANNVTNKALMGRVGAGGNGMVIFNADGTYPGANNAVLVLNGACEVN